MSQNETYKIYINDRNYTSWEIFETEQFKKIDILKIKPDFNPIHEKIFSNDVFSIINNKVVIVHSTVKLSTSIPGILIIKGAKTYGRKNNKLLYKCIPDDTRIPSFLIPYEIKHVGFSKLFVNLYITFNFCDWENNHPTGTIHQVIGNVDILDNYYEYQLYCKSLNASIQKFYKDTNKKLENKSHDDLITNIKEKYPFIEDRTGDDWTIFTIDPPKSLDFDDGFSISNLNNDYNNNIVKISIYISNVTIWLDMLNLWDSFSRRISTIYLPDKKRPMLPTILSDCLCSLQEKVTRIAFVMDIFVKEDEIIDIKYSNCFIKVFKNYCYEEISLLENSHYNKLFNITKKISKKYKYINNVRNSHELVCYLMILMNYHCANKLLFHKTGIFRSTIIKKEINIPEYLPEDIAKFMKIWNSGCGQYIDGSEIGSNNENDENDENYENDENSDKIIRHDMLDLDAYIHITSPIRRLVDLLNIIKFQQVTNIIELSENSDIFYKKWLNELEYINTTMRSIRKLQTDCKLLDICVNTPSIMEKEYKGYLFDKICRNDGLFQFIVYLPELNLSSRITLRDNFDNFDNKKFKLYLFNDEDSLKKKIRLNLL